MARCIHPRCGRGSGRLKSMPAPLARVAVRTVPDTPGAQSRSTRSCSRARRPRHCARVRTGGSRTRSLSSPPETPVTARRAIPFVLSTSPDAGDTQPVCRHSERWPTGAESRRPHADFRAVTSRGARSAPRSRTPTSTTSRRHRCGDDFPTNGSGSTHSFNDFCADISNSGLTLPSPFRSSTAPSLPP